MSRWSRSLRLAALQKTYLRPQLIRHASLALVRSQSRLSPVLLLFLKIDILGSVSNRNLSLSLNHRVQYTLLIQLNRRVLILEHFFHYFWISTPSHFLLLIHLHLLLLLLRLLLLLPTRRYLFMRLFMLARLFHHWDLRILLLQDTLSFFYGKHGGFTFSRTGLPSTHSFSPAQLGFCDKLIGPKR